MKNNLHNRPLNNYNLRRVLDVTVPIFRTTSFRNSYPIVSCRLFNKLPSSIKIIRNLNPFLNKVKSWLFSFNHDEIEILLQVIAWALVICDRWPVINPFFGILFCLLYFIHYFYFLPRATQSFLFFIYYIYFFICLFI